MLSDKQRGILRDIMHQIALAERFIENHDLESFERDELHLYAVTRCLEIISEASRGLPDKLKARHPLIEWKQMASAGNVYRHDYQGIAAVRIWDAVKFALPPLRAVIERELARDT
jgi:uncharacterized protein with HEPN domain